MCANAERVFPCHRIGCGVAIALVGLALVGGCDHRSQVVEFSSPAEASWVDMEVADGELTWPVIDNRFLPSKPPRLQFLSELENFQPLRRVWQPRDDDPDTDLLRNVDPELVYELDRATGALPAEPVVQFDVPLREGSTNPSIAISPDGKYLAIGDGEIKLWDVANKKQLWLAPANIAGQATLGFSPDSQSLVIASGEVLYRLTTSTLQLEEQSRLPTTIVDIDIASQSGHVLVTLDSGRVVLYEPSLQKSQLLVETQLEDLPPPRLDKDGQKIAFWKPQTGLILKIDAGGKVLRNEVSLQARLGPDLDEDLGAPLEAICGDRWCGFVFEHGALIRDFSYEHHLVVYFPWKVRALQVTDRGSGAVLFAWEKPVEGGQAELVLTQMQLFESQFYSANQPLPPISAPVLASGGVDHKLIALVSSGNVRCLKRVHWPATDVAVIDTDVVRWVQQREFDKLERFAALLRAMPEPRLQRSGEHWYLYAIRTAGRLIYEKIRDAEADGSPEALQAVAPYQEFLERPTRFPRLCKILVTFNQLSDFTMEVRQYPLEHEIRKEHKKRLDAYFDLINNVAQEKQPPMAVQY